MSATAITPEMFLASARGFIGTPFHHQARSKGFGVDCVGLIVCAAREAGYSVRDVTDYGRDPDGESLVRMVAEQLECVERPEPGDVLMFWVARPGLPQHVGIYAGETMIHAPIGRRVCEHRLTRVMLEKLHSIWRFPRG